MRFRAPLLAAVAFVFGLTACEDPSNVGLGLVGGEGGQPVVITLEAETFAPGPLDDVTGDAARVLAGRVQDALLGDFQATGYVDFGAALLGETFRTNPVTSAVLRLRPDYRYGDTTSTVTFRLRSMPAEWTATGAGPDTSLAAGAAVTEFTFRASDTLVVVPLPQSWISRNDTTLRGTTFIESFHGFEIMPVSGNAVVGFDRARSQLRAFASSDSATYATVKTLTTVTRSGSPGLPPGRIALQDAAGPGLHFAFDLDQAALRQTGLNRAVIRLQTDTTLVQAEPGFVRPRAQQLDLYAITGQGDELAFERAEIDSSGAFTFSSNVLRLELQEVLLGKQTIERFELRFPPSTNTVDVAVFHDTTAEGTAPKALFTVTRVE